MTSRGRTDEGAKRPVTHCSHQLAVRCGVSWHRLLYISSMHQIYCNSSTVITYEFLHVLFCEELYSYSLQQLCQMQTSGVDNNVDAVVVSADDIENLANVEQPSTGNGDDQNSASLQNLPGVLNDISLMYILQQQQPQPAGSVIGDAGAGMMMVSPAALQSLLVSQMVAAVNSGMSCSNAAAQSVVAGSDTRFIQLFSTVFVKCTIL